MDGSCNGIILRSENEPFVYVLLSVDGVSFGIFQSSLILECKDGGAGEELPQGHDGRSGGELVSALQYLTLSV